MGSPVRRIAVVRPRFLGDVVLTLPAMAALRAAFPEARTTYISEPAYVALLHGQTGVDEVWELPRGVGTLPFVRRCREAAFDLWIDLFGNPRTALLTALSGARRSVGPDVGLRGRAYSQVARMPPGPLAAPRFYLSFLEACGVPVDGADARPRLSLAVDAQEWASRFLLRNGLRRFAALAPGASHPAKRWPAERFAETARRLSERGMRTVFVLGPKERREAGATRSIAPRDAVFAADEALPNLAALLARAAVFVGNDAGPLHVARAVGTPTVGVFGPGVPDVWFAERDRRRESVVRRELPCSPCARDECPGLAWRCLLEIAPEVVVAEALRVMRSRS